MRFNHSNKHIRDAIRYAEGKNWRVTKAGPRAHIWGKLWCPHRARDGCRTQVLSTPKNPELHARDIRRYIDRCPHTGNNMTINNGETDYESA